MPLRISAAAALVTAACWRSTAAPAPEAPPPTAAAAPDTTTWTGACEATGTGWTTTIRVTLHLREDHELAATGTLAFEDRRTRARLRGPRGSGARHTLHGQMVEVGGIGTRWDLVLELERRGDELRGRFIEQLDTGGEQEMCRFVWRARAATS